MINGVMQIVAAVLFAVVHVFGNMGIIWLWIAAAYLAMGIVNLIVYAARNHRKQKQSARQLAETAEAE